MKTFKWILKIFLSLLPGVVLAQTTPVATMTNLGVLSVGDNATLYVGGSFLTDSASSILQNGTTCIDGHFLQNVRPSIPNHAFKTDPETGWGVSSGRVVFSGDNTGKKRYIMPKGDNATFDRARGYIAFPTINIATKDTIFVTSRMGIDAKQLTQDSIGKLWLRSENIAGSIYDASLRITDSGTSESLVPAGSVVLEREVGLYRDEIAGKTPLFAFASPFKNTQQAGYFAGNWVRRLIADENGHVEYVLGNKSADGTNIDRDQFFIDASEKFVPGNGQLVRLRNSSFDYQQLINQGGLWMTDDGAANYQVNKFTFNGNVYQMSPVNEQLFADDNITRTITTQPAKTVYWIFGNSYTAPISLDSLQAAMARSSINFYTTIYLFPAGSTTYQSYELVGGSVQTINPAEIPATGIVMLSVSNTTATGSFAIDKTMLIHGNASHNTGYNAPQAPKEIDEALFRVSPVSNDFIYDLTAIGIRAGSSRNRDSQDMEKILNRSIPEAFQLYSVSDNGYKLSSNVAPTCNEPFVLAFESGETPTQFNLQASRMESITQGDGLWLEDLVENQTVDLFATGGFYTFYAKPDDLKERFLVHFYRTPTMIENTNAVEPKIIYDQDVLHVLQLTDNDLNASVSVYDIQGRMVFADHITATPRQDFNLSSLNKGIYIARMNGQQVLTVKFLKR